MSSLKETIYLPHDWYEYVRADSAVDEQPGIYEWRIEGVGLYIGKYSFIKRPKEEYTRNVNRILNNCPYRPKNRDGFRRIHRELAAAHPKGIKMTLTILENETDPKARNRRERGWIAQRRTEEKAGGLAVLNSN